jgi:hypothetical protein
MEAVLLIFGLAAILATAKQMLGRKYTLRMFTLDIFIACMMLIGACLIVFVLGVGR